MFRNRILLLVYIFLIKKQINTGFLARLKMQRESDIARTIYQPPWKLTDLLYDSMCLTGNVVRIIVKRKCELPESATVKANLEYEGEVVSVQPLSDRTPYNDLWE